MTDTSTPETLSFKEFAELRGVRPSYVTALRKAGRLVLTEDGKRVRVAESIERIEATRDPARADVVQRHAAARGKAPPLPDEPEDEEGEAGDEAGGSYQSARAMKERYLAMAAKRDYEVSIGKLIPIEQAAADISSVVTTLRATLEMLPDTLATVLLGETDEARMRTLMAEEIERALTDAARAFARYTRGAAE